MSTSSLLHILETKPINPRAELLVREGSEWVSVSRRFLPNGTDHGAGVYLLTLPERWMSMVEIGSARMRASVKGETFVFDGLGWQHEVAS